jgi:hypothetical protein
MFPVFFLVRLLAACQITASRKAMVQTFSNTSVFVPINEISRHFDFFHFHFQVVLSEVQSPLRNFSKLSSKLKLEELLKPITI